MAQYVYTMRRVAKVVPPHRTILKDISLSFFPDAKIGVLGLNGSGKSSLVSQALVELVGEYLGHDVTDAEEEDSLEAAASGATDTLVEQHLTARASRTQARTTIHRRAVVIARAPFAVARVQCHAHPNRLRRLPGL